MPKMKYSVRDIFLSLICLTTLPQFSACRTGDSSLDSNEESFMRIELCDVIIAGGSAAALGAALASADQKVKTCLIEPTNWAGGQMTASGVPAIDFAHHTPNNMNLPAAATNPVNWNQHFQRILGPFFSNPGKCWVSNICYEPEQMINRTITPAIEQRQDFLKVYFETVVKSVRNNQGLITQLTAIKRKARAPSNGYSELFSSSSKDWYSPIPSSTFEKEVVIFRGLSRRYPVVIDASEFGDVLVLSGAEFLQGVEVSEDTIESDDKCGQAIVYPFVLEKARKNPLNNVPVIPNFYGGPLESPDQSIDAQATLDIPSTSSDLPNFFSLGRFSWERVWSYRRLSAKGLLSRELSLQNWNPGNDYPGGYFLKSKADTISERPSWSGGLDRDVLRRAEDHSYAWANYYIAQKPKEVVEDITMNLGALGSGHGFSKMPYIRDTRRSVGISGFLLKFSDLNGTATNSVPIGTPFPDRVAIGAYIADFHNVMGCTRRAYLNNFSTLPFFIPFRALTNQTVANLLVAGKTMAQTYHANAATRLQPIEWNSGAAAGVAAAFMIQNSIQSTSEVQQQMPALQAAIKEIQPLDWRIDQKVFPGGN